MYRVSNTLSLARILALTTDGSQTFLYKDQCFFCLEHKIDTENNFILSILGKPTTADAITTLVCHDGSMTITYNTKQYVIKKNCIFFCHPKSVIQIDNIDNLKLSCCISSVQFMQSLNPSVQKLVPFISELKNSRVYQLNEEQVTMYINQIKLMRQIINTQQDSIYYSEAVRSLLLTMSYTCMGFQLNSFKQNDTDTTLSTRKEEIFKLFIHQLTIDFHKERKVLYYAKKLNMSPKYLSTIINEVSHRSASDWIDDYVMTEAKNLLQYSDMSIQEISILMHFANQSFFGKYFKAHTGLSPIKFRNEVRRGNLDIQTT